MTLDFLYIGQASHVDYGGAFLWIDLYTSLNQQKPEELVYLHTKYTFGRIKLELIFFNGVEKFL